MNFKHYVGLSSSSSSVPGEYEEEYDPVNDVHVPKRKTKSSAQTVPKAEPFYEIVPSLQRNHTLLQAGGFRYYHNRTSKKAKYYACMHKKYPHKCPGSGKLNTDTDVFYSYASHTCDKPLDVDEES